MDRPCLPAIHFLLLPGVDAANFLGDLLRQFSLDEHTAGSQTIDGVEYFCEKVKTHYTLTKGGAIGYIIQDTPYNLNNKAFANMCAH